MGGARRGTGGRGHSPHPAPSEALLLPLCQRFMSVVSARWRGTECGGVPPGPMKLHGYLLWHLSIPTDPARYRGTPIDSNLPLPSNRHIGALVTRIHKATPENASGARSYPLTLAARRPRWQAAFRGRYSPAAPPPTAAPPDAVRAHRLIVRFG